MGKAGSTPTPAIAATAARTREEGRGPGEEGRDQKPDDRPAGPAFGTALGLSAVDAEQQVDADQDRRGDGEGGQYTDPRDRGDSRQDEGGGTRSRRRGPRPETG